MQKEEISNIVREVMKERGLLDNSKSKPDPKRIRRSRTAPAVLNVFHAGIRKLEQALEQVRLIEQTTRCILDTVRPEGLEKALEKSDILVLPTFCFKTAAKAARMINDDQETAIVISALIQGKPVLATRDGFTLLESLSNKNIREEIKRILDKLEGFGITFCETDQLFSVFQKIVVDKKNTESPTAIPQAGNETPPALRLITAKDILTAVNSNHDSIQLAPGGMVTPLARDQAKEYSITIVKTSS
jgi:hypothetical protein